MSDILIVYYYWQEYPPRSTIVDHLYGFERHTGHRYYYLNLALRSVPPWLQQVPFDLVIFHTIFLSLRFDESAFANVVDKARPLQNLKAVKIALPQDEFINSTMLNDFINEFGIDCVFSVAPASEWPKIYRDVDQTRVKFYEVLTGYLNDATIRRIEDIGRSISARPIDIGYRAWRAAPWLGRHGLLKTEIADRFQEAAPSYGLQIDISTRYEDTFLGDDWHRFLLRCKYVIGVEGGASILDPNGKIKNATESYMASHPQATFEEIERACFPGQDGQLALLALSPRHLEACVTRTCQILIEGNYNGILLPGRHYIELKRDFSNLAAVLEQVKRDELRAELTTRAYQDVVASRQYTYQSFVEFVLEKALGGRQTVFAPATSIWLWRRAQIMDQLSWLRIALSHKYHKVMANLPTPIWAGLSLLKRTVLRVAGREV